MNPERPPITAPVIDESLRIDKRQVDHGGWRIVRTVSKREEAVDEPLVAQTVHVERRAVGRLLPSLETPAARQEGDTLIVPVVEEVLVAEKRLMLREELHITRTASTRRHAETFVLRREDVAIERLDPDAPPADETP